jgi:hypothetical protein
MYIRLEFKEKNFLQFTPGEMLVVLPAKMIIDTVSVNKSEFGARWDKEKWLNEGRIVLDVFAPLLGHHISEVIGTASEMAAIAKLLETLEAP